jgi:hypothetical protein
VSAVQQWEGCGRSGCRKQDPIDTVSRDRLSLSDRDRSCMMLGHWGGCAGAQVGHMQRNTTVGVLLPAVPADSSSGTCCLQQVQGA